MAEPVQRYHHEQIGRSTKCPLCRHVVIPRGEWVRYSDYEALATRVEELEGSLADAEINHRNGLEIIDRLRTRAENAETDGWVSVEDEPLPPVGERILIVTASGCVRYSRLSGCDCAEEVTHWMPLPAPPEATEVNDG